MKDLLCGHGDARIACFSKSLCRVHVTQALENKEMDADNSQAAAVAHRGVTKPTIMRPEYTCDSPNKKQREGERHQEHGMQQYGHSWDMDCPWQQKQAIDN